MAKTAAQYFIKNYQNTPFNQFLKKEKEKHGCSWKSLDEICGVNRVYAYVMAMTNGVPNRPPHDKFLKIIHALGYEESDFTINTRISWGRGLKKYPIREYKEHLRILGENILEITQRSTHPQKLSVPIIKEACGDTFYQKYGRRYSDRQKLHQELIKLDPKFSVIELQHQEQHRTGIRNLEKFEEDIIETSLLNYLGKYGQPSHKRLPNNTIPYVLDEINNERKKKGLPPRTHASIVGHINKIWSDYHKRYTHSRGSPAISAGLTDQILVERIEEIVERQRKTPDTTLITDVLFEEDIDNRKRELYRRYSDEGHTKLILFLMEPENYLEFISKDVELFAIDFNESEVDESLKEEYKGKMELLKTRREELPDESEVIEFIDSWLRCDVIFTRKGGGFVVIEVKQSAVNVKNGFKNGTKACQQLAAYTAVILDNILRHNIENINAADYRPIKESVEGILVAYNMDRPIVNHLNRTGNKRPVIIPKQRVDDFVNKLHNRRKIEQMPIIPKQESELSHLIKSR